MVREVAVTIKGKPTYERWSVYQWITGFKDILENEYGVLIKVATVDGEEDLPIIIVDGVPIETYFYEEGYVFEALKKTLDKLLENPV